MAYQNHNLLVYHQVVRYIHRQLIVKLELLLHVINSRMEPYLQITKQILVVSYTHLPLGDKKHFFINIQEL